MLKCYIEKEYLIVEQILPDEYKKYNEGCPYAYRCLD